jgi:hypothetical protein
MEKERICPLCKGEGFYTPVTLEQRHIEKRFRLTQAKKYRDMGFSIREIAKIMGYGSPRSVQVLLKTKNK